MPDPANLARYTRPDEEVTALVSISEIDGAPLRAVLLTKRTPVGVASRVLLVEGSGPLDVLAEQDLGVSGALPSLDSIDLTAAVPKELLVAVVEGSGGYLRYWIYSLARHQFDLLAERGPIRDGTVSIDGTAIKEAGELLLVGRWDGSTVIWIDVSPAPKAGDVVLQCELDGDMLRVTATEVALPVGARLFIKDCVDRGSFKVLTQNGPLSREHGATFKAGQPGSGTIVIVPYLPTSTVAINVTVR